MNIFRKNLKSGMWYSKKEIDHLCENIQSAFISGFIFTWKVKPKQDEISLFYDFRNIKLENYAEMIKI